ncbi:hypothetical protein GCM10010508_36350 [Streptomyces naganishii JCM 4654]|uniref:Uncharacterized protein n=1 Tax=Streptomyces naganishii JCM 4654 TaxID=1306179 RepID=A0A918Y5K7_9ACTN|nr:hypothetical protein GCM10010508_36350 [Streptomyces naganishii JCM 4654]
MGGAGRAWGGVVAAGAFPSRRGWRPGMLQPRNRPAPYLATKHAATALRPVWRRDGRPCLVSPR